MRKKLLTLAVLCAASFFAQAQSFVTSVSTPYQYLTYLTMYSSAGTIQGARFTGAPYVRKVNSTNDVLVGVMTNGVPPQIYGHASVVFQYYPNTNTINLPPGTAHISTWWGNQQCRVYENGTCNCNGPNWNVCSAPISAISAAQVALARAVRINTKIFLAAQGITVTENAVEAGSTELAETMPKAKKTNATTNPDILLMSKKVKKTK